VFANQKLIFVTKEINNVSFSSNDQVVKVTSPEEIKNTLTSFFLDKTLKRLFFYSHNYKQLKADFRSLFREILAAGGMVSNENREFLLIFRRGKWDLPKGKCDNNESAAAAAVREVKEETGLKKPIIAGEPLITRHIYEQGNEWILKITYWYPMTASKSEVLTPQKEEDITKVLWANKEKINEAMKNSYPSIHWLFELHC
ncbi:MAG: NUDIX domain-containing protein, partial [Bacteroidales bacterium]|nr:NUDIX domain-containing protein [Bacteroidales bacterium]